MMLGNLKHIFLHLATYDNLSNIYVQSILHLIFVCVFLKINSQIPNMSKNLQLYNMIQLDLIYWV